MKIRFEWDQAKAASNLRKHGISFEIAARVFADPFAHTSQDRCEGNEQRWQTIGMVGGHVVLLVAHCVPDADECGDIIEVIRIISARKAERKERRRYEQDTDKTRN